MNSPTRYDDHVRRYSIFDIIIIFYFSIFENPPETVRPGPSKFGNPARVYQRACVHATSNFVDIITFSPMRPGDNETTKKPITVRQRYPRSIRTTQGYGATTVIVVCAQAEKTLVISGWPAGRSCSVTTAGPHNTRSTTLLSPLTILRAQTPLIKGRHKNKMAERRSADAGRGGELGKLRRHCRARPFAALRR